MPTTKPAAPTAVRTGLHAQPRPVQVTAVAGICFLLAALTVTGALMFNLIGVDNAAALVKGLLLILWAIGYVLGALGVLRRSRGARTLLIVLFPWHLALNILKVAGGETFSCLFLVLIIAAAVGLLMPRTSRWLTSAA